MDIENNITFALAINLNWQPRINHNGTGMIAIHSGCQAKENQHLLALHTAKHWGWLDPSLHSKI